MVDCFFLHVKVIKTVVNNLGPDVPDAQLIGPHSARVHIVVHTEWILLLKTRLFLPKTTLFLRFAVPQTQKACYDEDLCHW